MRNLEYWNIAYAVDLVAYINSDKQTKKGFAYRVIRERKFRGISVNLKNYSYSHK